MTDVMRGALLPMALAIIACLLLMRAAGSPFRVSRPPIALAIFCMAMTTLGSISYLATNFFFPTYFVPIDRALLYAALGIAFAALGVWLVNRVPKTTSPAKWEWSQRTFDHVMWALLALTLFGTLVTLARIGYIPIFRGDIRVERLQYTEQAGLFFRLSLLGTPLAMLAGLRWFLFGRARSSLLVMLIGLGAVSLYGPRFFAFLAAGVLFTLYDLYVRRVRLVFAFAAAVAFLVLSFWASVRRESAGAFVFDQPDATRDWRGSVVALGYSTFPEFRDFAWSIEYFDSPGQRRERGLLAGAVVPLLPGPVWSVLGVNKGALFSNNSATIMQEILQVDVGIRVGLLGELYMMGGAAGIVIGMFVFGLMVGWLDRRLILGGLSDPFTLLAALIALTSIFAMVGIMSMWSSTIVYFGWPLAAAMLLAARPGPAPEWSNASVVANA
jgi:hypothetical protein